MNVIDDGSKSAGYVRGYMASQDEIAALRVRVRHLEAGLAEYAKAENWAIHDDVYNGGANVWAPGGDYDPKDMNGFDLARAALSVQP